MDKEQVLDTLFAYVVSKRLEYEEELDNRPWRSDFCAEAISILEDIEDKIRDLS